MKCQKCGKDISTITPKMVNTKYGAKPVIPCPYGCKDDKNPKYPYSNWIDKREATQQPQSPSESGVILAKLEEVLSAIHDLKDLANWR